MNFQELVNQRQSVRRYLKKPVEREKIGVCLEAGRLAPSASNGQPWKFIVVDEPNLRAEVADATTGPMWSFNNFVPQAPVIIAIVMEDMKIITRAGAVLKEKNYALMDIGIAAQHICLQAEEFGLGTCMLGWFDEKKVKKLLQVPGKKRIILLITMGYAPEDYKIRKKSRKSFGEVVGYNGY